MRPTVNTPPILLPAAPSDALALRIQEEVAVARAFAEASRAASTRRAYATDWRAFAAWCADRELTALPASPATVAVWLSAGATAGAAPATIGRRLAALGDAHRRAGHPVPLQAAGGSVIQDVIAGIRR